MSERRSYQQFCGLARALDRVGERWTLLVVRNLLLGPRRYGELLAGLPGITTNLLAKRLKEMEELGLIEKRTTPSAGSYALTALGAALEPVIMELGRWGGRYLGAPLPGDRLDVGWALISLKRRYRGGLTMVAELTIGERCFELSFSPSYLAVQERAAALPAVRLKSDLAAFRALFWAGTAFRGLSFEVSGDDARVVEFLSAFDGVNVEGPTPAPSSGPPARALGQSSAAAPPESAGRGRKKAPAARAAKRGA